MRKRYSRLLRRLSVTGWEHLTEKDYQDIYALALNRLPARYCQKGTIVVGEPVREADVEEAVRDAFDTVIRRPKE